MQKLKALLKGKMNRLALIMILGFLLISCSEDCPVKTENRSPEILSLAIFPELVNPADSLIVICTATDPDGDSLVYDWITTGVVRIKGYNHPWFYNDSKNSHIFYAPDSQFVTAPRDTFWIQCFARDGKGGTDAERIYFIVTN